MKLRNFIKSEVNTTVQGFAIVVIVEREEGKTPNLYKCDFSGEIPPVEEGGVTLYFNGNAILNASERKVQVWSSENVPVGFLGALETEMLKVHEFVMSKLEA